MMASTIESEESRASLIAMAQTWLRLAEEPLSVPPEVSDRPQPAVQQQQQKQPEDERDDEPDGAGDEQLGEHLTAGHAVLGEHQTLRGVELDPGRQVGEPVLEGAQDADRDRQHERVDEVGDDRGRAVGRRPT